MNIPALEKEIQGARDRGDLVEVARLRFQLPLSYRSHELLTAVGRVKSFLPVETTDDETAGEPARRAQPTTRTSWPTVSMHSTTHHDLRNEEFDGREHAGFLVGNTDTSAGLEVWSFFQAYNPDTNTWRSASLDLDRALARLVDLPTDQTLIGDYHVHPNDSTTKPSDQDLNHWASFATMFHRSEWIGMVICGFSDRIKAEIRTHVVRPDRSYSTVDIHEVRL